MNERLVEVIRYMRALYINRLPLRNIHTISKMDLFLYLFVQDAIYKEREGLGITFKLDIDNMGLLSLRAMDIENETTFAVWDTIAKGLEENSFDKITEHDKLSIENIISKYGMHQYTELLTDMTKSTGNSISPILVDCVPLPYMIDDEFLKNKLRA